MKIGFYGAAQNVTGSKHLITLKSGKQILLDCGLFQGRGKDTFSLNVHFGFDPSKVDYLVLSHAHIDHSGLIPRLVRQGFKGDIYCTPATRDLCEIMLKDSAKIQEADMKYINKRRRRKKKGKPDLQPLYNIEDVEPALKLFKTLPYLKKKELEPGIELQFTDVGHIIGSAAVHLRLKDGNLWHRVTFSGDIGRYQNRLLRDPQPFPQADYLICESTYGNREHVPPPKAEKILLDAVLNTCVEKKGKLIIPAFSIGRTQEIVNILNNLHFENKLPQIPVYVDSPLSTSATQIMRKHKYSFRKNVQEYMEKDPTPFGFSTLRYVRDAMESKALNDSEEPCIVISASGMAEAGRIKHHLMHGVSNPKNTVAIVGWCSTSSLGGKLARKDKEVYIFGERFEVKADVVVMNPFSAHGDYNEMLKFLSCQEKHILKNIFLVHGNEEIMPAWKSRLHNAGYHNITIPKHKEVIEI